MEKVADAGILAKLAPDGRVPRDFPARVRRAAREIERALAGAPDPIDRGLRAGEAPVHVRGIEVGRVLESRKLTIRVGRRDRAFERRVGSALTLLERHWPEGRALVGLRAWCVVPVDEWATVSYSSARKPGILYVHVASKPTLRLAEDLVHESAHVRLHEIESLHRLLTREATSSDGPRFYSPWRREWRPLRGLLHAAYTFTVGARFFERMREGRFSPTRLAWLDRRLLEERLQVELAIGILRAGARRGLLTDEGKRFARAIAREHRSLAASARTAEARLRGTRELQAARRLAGELARRPVRWG